MVLTFESNLETKCSSVTIQIIATEQYFFSCTVSDAVRSGSNSCIGRSGSSKVLHKVGNAIYCVNLYSVDNAIKLKVGNGG